MELAAENSMELAAENSMELAAENSMELAAENASTPNTFPTQGLFAAPQARTDLFLSGG